MDRQECWLRTVFSLHCLDQNEAFSRVDDRNDREFYSKDRFVNHLDSVALETVSDLIGKLIVEPNPVILDLMTSWDSHLPDDLKVGSVTGLGLNENELGANKALDKRVVHDLNEDPKLPFDDDTFDVVINTVSVEYLVRPIDVFAEAGRVLKPGGLFLVIFSNRMFPEKAIKLWQDSDEDERVLLVEDFFKETDLFDKPSVFISKGKPRPKDDKYAGSGLMSDPIYAVYADKKGGVRDRLDRPVVRSEFGLKMSSEEYCKKCEEVKETLRCPHCGEKLKKWAVPDNPFCQTWDNEYMYICFNNSCPYFVRGWDQMYHNSGQGTSYRLMYNPVNDCCLPIPVPTTKALTEGIME